MFNQVFNINTQTWSRNSSIAERRSSLSLALKVTSWKISSDIKVPMDLPISWYLDMSPTGPNRMKMNLVGTGTCGEWGINAFKVSYFLYLGYIVREKVKFIIPKLLISKWNCPQINQVWVNMRIAKICKFQMEMFYIILIR